MSSKLKYYLTRISRMHYGAFFRAGLTVHKKSHRFLPADYADIIHCGLTYGAGYTDYILYDFYNLSEELRATYVTRGVNNRLIERLNNPAYYRYFDDKQQFCKSFREYLGREFLLVDDSTEQQIADFCRRHEVLFLKPSDGSCGQGIEKLILADHPDKDELAGYIKTHKGFILDEEVVQHPAVASLYPKSVNTLRIGTIRYEGVTHVMYAFIRIGNHDKSVDNLNAGGICAPLDLETGAITHPAYDKEKNTYTAHPQTGTPLVGFTVPYFKEALDLCCRASEVFPQMGYIGWDIAITEHGPVMIEGNNMPGHDILQLPAHQDSSRVGMLPAFRAVVPDL